MPKNFKALKKLLDFFTYVDKKGIEPLLNTPALSYQNITLIATSFRGLFRLC